MADISDTVQDKRSDKELYSYQKGAIDRIFLAFEEAPDDYHLLYQLPTGGGKTVIFSEIVRQYLKTHKKKVLVMTHRVELCKQTSNMLTEFGVKNKVVNSTANLDDQNDYMCFVAMVETLNNRLLDDVLDVSGVGLVIIDEAHYNSFTKIFKFFSKSFLLGVTATPLSSNTKLPMNENYNELIAGETIQALIENEFLAKANMYAYNVGLTSLTIGANGDYRLMFLILTIPYLMKLELGIFKYIILICYFLSFNSFYSLSGEVLSYSFFIKSALIFFCKFIIFSLLSVLIGLQLKKINFFQL